MIGIGLSIGRRRLPLLAGAGTIVVLALAGSSCSLSKAPSPDVDGSALLRLAAADAEVQAGCFECLQSAFAEFTSLRSVASVSKAATVGAAHSAVLLAIREREIGALDSGYLLRAREIVRNAPATQEDLALLLEIADSLPFRGEGILPADEFAELARMQAAARNRDEWTAYLRARAADDALSAYLWIAFNCSYMPTAEHAIERWLEKVAMWKHTALVAFKASTCGPYPKSAALRHLLHADARFLEVHYFLAVAHAFTGHIDEALGHRLTAYAWRLHWPALTHSLAIDYMAIEEFDVSVRFLDRTLALAPNNANVLLNKAKALSHAGRFGEALEALDPLLRRDNAFTGEAHYWRAFNHFQLRSEDEAWAAIEVAAKHLQNASVPKLAGLIAYRRKELKLARENFELSWRRDRSDCETGYFLGIVSGELAWWFRTADVLVETISCLEKAEVRLNAEIDAIRASTQPLERKTRQISKRDAEIARQRRMAVVASYNTAVSYLNSLRQDEARPWAERIRADQEFGQRALGLLALMKHDGQR